MDRGAGPATYSPWDCKESATTEHISLFKVIKLELDIIWVHFYLSYSILLRMFYMYVLYIYVLLEKSLTVTSLYYLFNNCVLSLHHPLTPVILCFTFAL